MKKYILIALLLGFFNICTAQINPPKLYSKFGIGASFSGTGDMTFYELNGGFNYTFSKYVTGDFNLSSGAAIVGHLNPPASILKTDVNILISPFGNYKLIDLRIGGGLGYQYSPRTFVKSVTVSGSGISGITYEEELIRAFGFNTIIEIVGTIDEKTKVSIFSRISPYFSGLDINSGVSINLYRRF